MPAPNRLQYETSPYLLQHASNPVDWWPWSVQAFAEARRRDVPVLISVGYSACHWCHVMAHESFEDSGVAEVLNGAFVAVKVDREERPDIDAVYMEALQLVSGGGGWPMTVIALPDGRPFWAGTYLPRANFLSLLHRVERVWSSERGGIEADAERLAEAVREGATLPQRLTVPGGRLRQEPGEDILRDAAEALLGRVDPEWGGFGEAPKFPQPASLELLAEYWWRSRDDRALGALANTLDAMSSGGIYDHLAGGFAALQHRPVLARPPLRENALRQRLARAGLHARLAVDRLPPLPPGGRRNRRLPAEPAHAPTRRRVGLSRGR